MVGTRYRCIQYNYVYTLCMTYIVGMYMVLFFPCILFLPKKINECEK